MGQMHEGLRGQAVNHCGRVERIQRTNSRQALLSLNVLWEKSNDEPSAITECWTALSLLHLPVNSLAPTEILSGDSVEIGLALRQ